jgi:hypothetical protein
MAEQKNRFMYESTIFWDIMLCSPQKATRRFGGTYRLHFHVLKQMVTCLSHAFTSVSCCVYYSTILLEVEVTLRLTVS